MTYFRDSYTSWTADDTKTPGRLAVNFHARPIVQGHSDFSAGGTPLYVRALDDFFVLSLFRIPDALTRPITTDNNNKSYIRVYDRPPPVQQTVRRDGRTISDIGGRVPRTYRTRNDDACSRLAINQENFGEVNNADERRGAKCAASRYTYAARGASDDGFSAMTRNPCEKQPMGVKTNGWWKTG